MIPIETLFTISFSGIVFYIIKMWCYQFDREHTWIDINNEVSYSYYYFFEVWLPARISDLKNGNTDWYDIDALPALEELLDKYNKAEL